MLSTKPISEVSWDDIEEFCQEQHSESANVEYKENFPKNLEKTLSAMANTIGGIVLVGVKETNESKPELPLVGISFERGLKEKVQQIILDNITPPFQPEVEVIKNQTGDKAIIFIRIPQSKVKPHAINRNTLVYRRTGNISTPEELVSINVICKYLDEQQDSIKQKENLYSQSTKRYINYLEQYKKTPEYSSSITPEIDTNAFVRVFCCPSFPFDKLTTPPELQLKVSEMQVRDSYGMDDKFPKSVLFSDNPGGILVKDGTVLLQRVKNYRLSYCEFNIFGSYFVQYPLGEDPRLKTIRISELLVRTHVLILSAINFYKSLGYWGTVDIEIMLGNLNNKRFFPDWYQWPYENYFCSPDNEATCEASHSVSELSTQLKEIHFSLVRSLLWSIDFELDQRIIDTVWKKFSISG